MATGTGAAAAADTGGGAEPVLDIDDLVGHADAARRLVDRGEIDIVQGGQIVDPSRAKGPIRLRRRPGGPLSPDGGAR